MALTTLGFNTMDVIRALARALGWRSGSKSLNHVGSRENNPVTNLLEY